MNKFAVGAVYKNADGTHQLTIVNRWLNLDTNQVVFEIRLDVIGDYVETSTVHRRSMTQIVQFCNVYKLEYVE